MRCLHTPADGMTKIGLYGCSEAGRDSLRAETAGFGL